MRLWTLPIFVVFSAMCIYAQPFSVAYPDDPFVGVTNPAYFGTTKNSAFSAKVYGRQNAMGSCFITGKGFGLGTDFNQDSYSLVWALALGNRTGGIGYIDRTVWYDGGKRHMWRFGVLSRPARWLAWGAAYSEFFGNDFRTGIAVRPGTERITLWADAILNRNWEYQNTLVGGEIMPIRGVHLYGSYDVENRAAWFGARIDVGHISISGGADEETEFAYAQVMLSQRRFRSIFPFRTKDIKLVLKGAYPETPSLFGGKTFSQLADAVADIADDLKVERLLIKDDGSLLTFSQREELRNELLRFKSRGGKIIVYVSDLGNGGMFLYSIVDTICLPPAGDVKFIGIGAELTYYKGLLDKIGVKADMIHIGEFKTAAEPYSADSMSEQMRQELTEILTHIDTLIVRSVAAGRNVSQDSVRSWIASAPYTAKQAKNAGMIDDVAYWDEFKEKFGWGEATDIEEYVDEHNELSVRWSEPPVIAIIPIEGGIRRGKSTPAGFLSSRSTGDETTARMLKKAAADRSIKGIILRINSPGGSAYASDQIWHAAKKASEKKLVWTSMGSYAASGGYYIAVASDTIFADATSITGSIGVVGGKFSVGGLFDKLGLRSETVYLSPNSNLYSLTDTFSTAQRKRFRENMKLSYQLFKERVLNGRQNLSPDSLEMLAQGKVHTGIAAAKNGLVDEIAGIASVQRKMAKKLRIDDEYIVRRYSPYSSFNLWELLEKLSVLPEEFSNERIPTMMTDNENLWYVMPYLLKLE